MSIYPQLRTAKTCRKHLNIADMTNLIPLGKITSQGHPEDFPKKFPDVLRTSHMVLYVAPRDESVIGTSLGRTQGVNVTIIHKITFYGIFSINADFNCISDIVLPK